jgi:hypothetical protein
VGLGVAFGLASAGIAKADTVTLVLVDSYSVASPFGLAFDGTNIWFSNLSGGNVARQMTTSGVVTGITTPTPFQYGALAWTGTQLAQASNLQVKTFDRITGGNQTTINVTGGVTNPYGLVDGLDIDNGNIFFSPDVWNIYKLTLGGSPDGPQPLVGGGGGFSGIERVDVNGNTYLIDVNDASSPRKLDIRHLDGSLIGQATLVNSRYEDLAFDGRYIYAADLYGNRIDKIDLQVEGQPILQADVPLPSTAYAGMALMGLCIVPVIRRRRNAQLVA